MLQAQIACGWMVGKGEEEGGAGSDSVSPRVQLVDKPDQSDGKS